MGNSFVAAQQEGASVRINVVAENQKLLKILKKVKFILQKLIFNGESKNL